MDTHSPDPSCLGSVDIEMENSVDTSRNSDEESKYADEPMTSDSWSTAIAKDFVVSSHAEETTRNNMACIHRIGPKPVDTLTRVVSDPNERIFYASDSVVIVYDREDDGSMVETTTRDRGQGVECSRFPTEIYEHIIDYVAERPHCNDLRDFGHWRFLTRALAHCARVCRAWVPRAQMHLFSAIDLSKIPRCRETHRALTGFWAAVQRKPFLLQYSTLAHTAYGNTT
ncbi:hypothetical protein QCA50_012528 [Cerrena zonata]|uniref:F-box domain-containing protein n=1 Tax=Cerrena zonata TaxID=2478898 RepID=A0AAW0G1E3_9APHY